MRSIEQTGKAFRQMKNETVQELRNFGKRKQAINSYMQNS
jgi:hypothetical protein